MNTLNFTSADSYKCVAISTEHLTDKDQEVLSKASKRDGMFMSRDYGFFLKLYDDAEYVADQCAGLSNGAKEVITAAYAAGFQLIEFDVDAEYISKAS